MPEIGVIQKPGLFEDLLRRLGVNRPTRAFTLDGNIVPVVLVESGVSFVASPTPPYEVTDIFTTGLQIAPAAGTVLADTGQLPVGAYSVQVVMTASDGAEFEFQWRNAGNTANLWTQLLRLHITSGVAWANVELRLLIANANERFRLLNAQAGGALTRYQASILARI